MSAIESSSQRVSKTYVGMTSAEGMCEAVEVIDSESSRDQYALAGGMSGAGGLNFDHCVLSAFRFALLAMIRGSQAAAAARGVQFLLEGERKKIPLAASKVLGAMAFFELVGHVGDRGMRYVVETTGGNPFEGKRPSFSQLWSRVWNDCGGPTRWGNPLHLPKWAKAKEKEHLRPPERVSTSRFVPRPLVDFNFDLPDLSPEALRNAALAAAIVIVIGGMILLAPAGI